MKKKNNSMRLYIDYREPNNARSKTNILCPKLMIYLTTSRGTFQVLGKHPFGILMIPKLSLVLISTMISVNNELVLQMSMFLCIGNDEKQGCNN